MLGVTYDQMQGMISALRLSPETVAGPARTCDRHADPEMKARWAEMSKHAFVAALRLHGFVCKVTGLIRTCDLVHRKDVLSSSSSSRVFLSPTVANGGLGRNLGVVRVNRNVHLGGRGPPAAKLRRNLIATNT